MSVFYENFLRLCTEHKKSPSGVAIAIGLSNAAASGWKKGKWPNDTTLYKIANYFGVSVEELKGQKEKTATPSGDSLSSDDPLTAELKAEIDTMSPDHKELLLAQIRIMKERTAK